MLEYKIAELTVYYSREQLAKGVIILGSGFTIHLDVIISGKPVTLCFFSLLYSNPLNSLLKDNKLQEEKQFVFLLHLKIIFL